MWMQTFYSHLSELGTAGFVMANGAMTTNNAGEKNVRKYMVDNGIIDCIVRLPDKLFMTTGIPACLFFLSKNREGKDGFRARKNEILFIDASKIGEMATRRLRVFSNEDIARISGVYNEWRKKEGKYENIAGFCKVGTLDEIIKEDYKLTPGIYVGTEVEEDDGVPFEEKIQGFNSKLKSQFNASLALQERILTQLEKL
jgi:type I restriction enzyme M protein